MPTVLIVEDEDLVREIAVVEFEEAGFRVIEAATGEAALAHLAIDPIDLLFTDIRLPGSIDGWQVARRARDLYPDLPVIYASGFPGDAIDVVLGGRFIRKPYRPTAIIAVARDLGHRGCGRSGRVGVHRGRAGDGRRHDSPVRSRVSPIAVAACGFRRGHEPPGATR